jgi:hypothetical protein
MNRFLFLIFFSIFFNLTYICSQNQFSANYISYNFLNNYQYTKKDSIHSPKKAALYSALLPGLGQGYNRKYWKIPIVYAGLGGSAYMFISNRKHYIDYRDAIEMRLDNDPTTIDPYIDLYTIDQLTYYKDYYRRNLEISVIAFVGVYLINILDAVVDAHLYGFSIDTDLSMIQFNNTNTLLPTVSLKYNFKKNNNDQNSYNRLW